MKPTMKSILLAGLAGLMATATAGVANAAGVNLTIWHLASDSPALMNLYKAYEKQSGNTITFVEMPPAGFETTTMTKWATGERPDVLEWHPDEPSTRQLDPAENVFDLSNEDFVKKNPDLYSSGPVIDGHVYAAMVNFPQVWGFYYNKAVFQKAGLKPPTNIQELFAVCKALKEKAPGVTPIFQAGGSGWPPLIIPLMYLADEQVNNAFAKSVLEKKVKVNDPKGLIVKSYTDYVALRDQGCYNADAASAKFEDSMAGVYKGTVALVPQHSDQTTTLDAIAGDPAKVDSAIGFVGWSAGGKNTGIQLSPFGSYFLPKTGNAEKEAAALGFVRFVTGEGYQPFVTDSGLPPIQKGAQISPTIRPLVADIKAAYDKGPTPFYNQTIPTGSYDVIINQLLAGQITPQAAADQLEVTVEQLAKASGLAGW